MASFSATRDGGVGVAAGCAPRRGPAGAWRGTRETSVKVLEFDPGVFFVSISLSSHPHTYLLSVDPTTGALRHSGTRGIDLFGSEEEAVAAAATSARCHISSTGATSAFLASGLTMSAAAGGGGMGFPVTGLTTSAAAAASGVGGVGGGAAAAACKSITHGRAVLGYVALGQQAAILLATRVRPSVRSLPSGDCVYTVVESQWVKMPLRSQLPLPKAEAKAAADLLDTQVNDLHFYCETCDLTRPFPSPHAVHEPDPEFVWNQWLSAPFLALGLPHLCAVLLQV